MNEKEEVLAIVKKKYSEATNGSDKLVVKWIGWLALFLSMDRDDRINMAMNEEEIARTKQKLTEELHAIRREAERTTTTNLAGVRDSSTSTRVVLQKSTTKNRETSKELRRRER